VGFLYYLYENELMNSVHVLCGVSFGSVICLLLVCGYTPLEIISIMVFENLCGDINTISFSEIMKNNTFITNVGIKNSLSKLILKKLGNIPSLYNLYLQTGKSFCITSMNITEKKSLIMSPFTYPNILCIDAVLYSMNIPFLFYELSHKNEILIDGMFGDSYPLEFFDDKNHDILGIYTKQIIKPENSFFSETVILKLVYEYFFNFYEIIIDQKRTKSINTCSELCKNIGLIHDQSYKPDNEFSIIEKGKFISDGYMEGIEFVKNLNYKQDKKIELFEYPTQREI
jgi:hypothetical protein